MVLKSVSSNLPPTPGRQVKYLTSELDKQEAENVNLQNTIASLTKALESINLVKESAAPSVGEEKKSKKDKNAPKAAVSAYKFFCEDVKDIAKGKTGKEMQQLWKECLGDDRKRYVDSAAEDKKRYERESAEYDALQKLYKMREQGVAMDLYEAHKIATQAIEAGVDKDGKKKKKTKDPDAPKRNKSGYMFYCEAVRSDMTKANTGKSPAEITKLLGEGWNKLIKGKGGKKGTKKYDDLAAKDKVRYEGAKAAYSEIKAEVQAKVDEDREMKLQEDMEEARKMVDEAQKETAAQQEAATAAVLNAMNPKKADKPKGPKRALTAYNYFVSESHEKVKATMPESSSFAEINAEVVKRWGSLTDEEKKPFVAKSNKDKERYQQEEARMETAAQQGGATADATKPKKADKPKGPKRALTAYNYFVSESYEKVKAMMPESSKFAEINAEVVKRWGSLTVVEKKPYVEKSNKDKERYQRDVEAMSSV